MNLHPETRLLHGPESAEPFEATVPPIVQSAAFAYETAEGLENVFAGREPGYVYSRITNPTVVQFERRLAALEGGRGAVACASGMAAIAAAVLGVAGAGDEIVSADSIFGGTWSLFARTLARYGIAVRFVEAGDPEAVRRAITERTRLVFAETIGNPRVNVPDLAVLAAVARERGVALAVDSTATSPVLVRPKELGAALVIHSASKYINGHGTAIGGVVVETGLFDWASPRYPLLAEWSRKAGGMAFLACLRNQVVRDLGFALSPFNAFLLTLGLESLGVRMERHCRNAERVAAFLAAHPKVLEARYPGLPAHPDRAVAERQFGGRFGGLLTLRLADKAACFRFINALERIRNVANLGDARTLVIHPASTFCRDLSEEARRAAGVTPGLVRLSAGLEHPDDIISDLEQALEKV